MTRRFAVLLLLSACGPAFEQDDATATQQQELAGTWVNIGTGVATLDTGNVLGSNVLIAYAGFNISLGQAQAWAGALYDARLADLGVRWIYAVQGPADSAYNGLEIGNSKIVQSLTQRFSGDMGFILVAGHSSGSFVADELLQQMDTGSDPFGAFGTRMVFFNLDGDQKYVAASGINRLRRAYYVNAFNPQTGVASWNAGPMSSLGAAFAGKGGTLTYDASTSGCVAGGCVHISLVNTKPHASASGSGIDYADFGGRPVNVWWLDAKRREAGLGQCATALRTEGLIQEAYARLGGCGSFLGAPTTDMLTTADGMGRYNNFAGGGSIYWSFFTGAHEVHGAIRVRWAELGHENGPLGYPLFDEAPGATRGRYSVFQHGAIYWSPATGAHEVVGKIYDAWAALNYENGELGLPVSNEQAVPGGRRTDFEHGAIIAYADGRVEVVRPVSPARERAVETEVLGPAPVTVVSASTPTQPEPSPEMSEASSGGCSATGGLMPFAMLLLALVVRPPVGTCTRRRG